MLEALHRVGSRIRHAPVIRNQRWLWNAIEVGWEGAFRALTRANGYETRVNGEIFRLDYRYGARYDRHDQHAYEPEFYGAFVRRVSAGMTVFDIGAHIGMFSLGAARRAGAQGRVVAFEPAPETLQILKRHVAYNRDLGPIDVVGAVISDREGSVSFYTYRESMAASVARANVEVLNPQVRDSPAKEVVVPSMTLDRFCRERNLRPDIMKIDVEGAEVSVLKGAREVLTGSRPTFLCEIHPKQMANCGSSLEELHAYLESVGYLVEPIDPPNPMGIFHGLVTAK